MKHIDETDLILFHYGEASDAVGVERHLARCERCRDDLATLRRDLTVFDGASVPPVDDEYPTRVWQRLQQRIDSAPERNRRWDLPGWLAPRRLAFAGTIALLMIAAFIAGRWNGQAVSGGPIPEQVRERILLVAVGDHLERSQRLLLELVNTPDGGTADLLPQQDRAARLASDNRLYRQTASQAGDEQIVELLEELERTLVEIANAPPESAQAELAELRRRVARRGILFRIRVVGKQTRQRGLERPGTGAGEV
jgi:anti-sigma factor RsiW